MSMYDMERYYYSQKGCTTWTGCTQLGIVLEKDQKRAARWVCGVKWNRNSCKWSQSYSSLCQELHWQTLEGRRSYLSNCQVYKSIHKLDAIIFDDYFHFKNYPALRSHHYSLLIPQSRINVFRFSFFINVPHLWNKLSPHIVNSPSLKAFKKAWFNFGSL